MFLTKEGVLKLGDLNVSKVAKRGMLQTQTGTPYYASPEVWQDRPYDYKSDIWSLGCVLYEMCSLQPPFRATDMQGLFKRVCSGQVPSLPPPFSKDLNHMVKLMLQQSPALRPSCPELLSKQQLVRNQPPTLEVRDSETDFNLIGTIRVPRNLG
jgi:NIMA (never in mitosis gene a)-related kinase